MCCNNELHLLICVHRITNGSEQMSKTIQNYIDKHPDKFIEWWNEDHNERGLDYWVSIRSPFFNPLKETQTIHTDTVAQALQQMRTVIKGKYNGHCWESI